MQCYIKRCNSDFFQQYSNWRDITTICLTFDIDFAPDFMIEFLMNLLKDNNIKATIFVTHASEQLKKLTQDNDVEFGIHPNLSNNSTQGNSLLHIIDSLSTSYPNMLGNRFHHLHYAYRDLTHLSVNGFEYDSSTLLFNSPYLLPAWHQDINMVILPYLWEDGICENAGMDMSIDNINLTEPGLKIINFHPMNIYINGRDASARQSFLKANPDLLNCSIAQADKYRQNGPGARDVLIDLIKFAKQRGVQFCKLNEVVTAFKKTLLSKQTGVYAKT